VQIPKVAVIAAAGIGSRLGLNIPKPLIDIESKSIISYQLELLKEFVDVRIVVGFMEHKLIDEVLKIRPDVVFVRNQHYMTTGPAHSFKIATKDLNEPALLLDGDTIIEPKDFEQFINSYQESENFIAVTETKTSNPICVILTEDQKSIEGFTNNNSHAFEWCGLSILSEPKLITPTGNGLLFEYLSTLTPINFFLLRAEEVDTPYDLMRTKKAISEWWKTKPY
jgi:choline kinase